MSNSVNITLPSFQNIQPIEQDGYMIVARDLVKVLKRFPFTLRMCHSKGVRFDCCTGFGMHFEGIFVA